MPPLDPDKLLAILNHPASLTAASLLAAALVSLIIGAQLRAIGLDRQEPTGGRLKWSTALAGLSFWVALLAGLHLVAMRSHAATLAALFTQGFVALLQLFPAGLLLAGASHHRLHMLRDAADRRGADEAAARKNAELLTLAAAALAALTVVGQVAAPILLLACIAGALWWLARNPDAFQKIEAFVRELMAGFELRRRGLAPGSELEIDGRPLRLIGPIGLVGARLKDGDEEREMSNSSLLALSAVTPPFSAP